MFSMFKGYVFSNGKLMEKKCYDLNNREDLFYYRGNITVKDAEQKNVFVIVNRKNGLPVSYGAKLEDARKALKKKVTSDESMARYEFFKAIYGASKVFINVGVSTVKGNNVATIEVNTKDIKFNSQKYLDEMFNDLLLANKKNSKIVGISGYSIYKSADDAANKSNSLFTMRFTKENCFKIENLYFGYQTKRAA